MKNYSIVRIGHEYVVQADAQNVLRVASRRRAAWLVSRAAELLNAEPRPQIRPTAVAVPSIERDPSEVP